jgi:D-methionine transport system substrate-binding protein
MKHRKIVSLLVSLLALLLLAGCGSKPAATTPPAATEAPREKLIVVCDLVPHEELVRFVEPKLKEQGVDLDIRVQGDYVVAQQQTNDKEIDVYFAAHWPALEAVSAEKGWAFGNAGNIHVEPIGAYSEKYLTKEAFDEALETVYSNSNRAKFAITNDATNEYRSLKILENNGYLTLKSTISPATTSFLDIESYLKPIEIVEMDAALIPRTRADYDAYILNTNRVLEAGIDTKTVLFREESDSPYANLLATWKGNENNPTIKKLYDALTTEEVRQFIETKYEGAVIPAF